MGGLTSVTQAIGRPKGRVPRLEVSIGREFAAAASCGSMMRMHIDDLHGTLHRETKYIPANVHDSIVSAKMVQYLGISLFANVVDIEKGDAFIWA